MHRGSLVAVVAAAGAVAADIVYLWTIKGEDQGELGSSGVIFVATCIGAAGVSAAVGAFAPNAWARLVLRAFAAFLLLLFTILGALSIGILLLVPAVLALRSTAHAAIVLPPTKAWATVAATAAADVAIVAVGIAVTS